MSTKELAADDWRLPVYGSTRITGASDRRGPRIADRKRVGAQQSMRCLYCELPIGVEIWRDRPSGRSGSIVKLRGHWDHFVPYSYSLANPATNWVLACHVCNGIKTARMFDSVEQARQTILPARLAKGYEAPESVQHRLRGNDDAGFESGIRPLTIDQLAVLRLIAAGLRDAEVASRLKISEGSVRVRLSTARRNLRASDRRETIEAAIKYGFMSAPAPIAPSPTAEPEKSPSECGSCGELMAEVEKLRTFMRTLEELLAQATDGQRTITSGPAACEYLTGPQAPVQAMACGAEGER